MICAQASFIRTFGKIELKRIKATTEIKQSVWWTKWG